MIRPVHAHEALLSSGLLAQSFYTANADRLSILSLSIDTTSQISISHSGAQHRVSTLSSLSVPAVLTPKAERRLSSSTAATKEKAEKVRPYSLKFSKAREALKDITRASNKSRPLSSSALAYEEGYTLCGHVPETHTHANSDVIWTTSATSNILITPDVSLASGFVPFCFTYSNDASPDSKPVRGSSKLLAEADQTTDHQFLKVSPPFQQIRERWFRKLAELPDHMSQESLTKEKHCTRLHFRLRLCSELSTQHQHSRSSTQLLFLAARNLSLLVEATKTPASALNSASASALEGITRIVVPLISPNDNVSGHGDCTFDWTWKALGASDDVATSTCCVAFVDFDPDKSTAVILSAFEFCVALPSPEKFIIGAQHEASLHLQSRSQASQPNLAGEIPSMQMPLIDWTELNLKDVQSDSPLFRAALVSLERRTQAMKHATKVALQATLDAKGKAIRAAQAELALYGDLGSLAAMFPDTLKLFQENCLLPAGSRYSKTCQENVSVLEKNLERPLQQILDACTSMIDLCTQFEADSKSYYSQTQKWLSSRSAKAPPLFNEIVPPNAMLTKAQQDRGLGQGLEQKVREMCFERSRLVLYGALYRLHGGKVELQLSQHITALCRWQSQWSNQQQSRYDADLALEHLSATLVTMSAQQDEQELKIKVREKELTDQIRTAKHRLQASTSQTLQADNDVKSAIEKVEASVSAESSTRMSKVKVFLGALQSSSVVQGLQGGNSSNASENRKSNKTDHVQRRISLGRKRVHADTHRTEVIMSPPLPTIMFPPDSRAKHNHRGRQRTEETAQSANFLADDALDTTDGAANVEPESTATEIFSASHDVVEKIGGPDRKKEGVLWVINKAIAGPVGGDAPRVASRSTLWKECWVVLSGSGQICEFADWRSPHALETSNTLIDLRFATVREARGIDRRFVFEIVTRDSRRFFQARDEQSMLDWMSAIVKAIESLLNGTSSVRKLDRGMRGSVLPTQEADRIMPDEQGRLSAANESNPSDIRKLLGGSYRVSSQSMIDLRTLTTTHKISTLSQGKPTKHERGISNKTPTSGYLAKQRLNSAAAQNTPNRDADGSSSSWLPKGTNDMRYDLNIEQIVQRSYGAQERVQEKRHTFDIESTAVASSTRTAIGSESDANESAQAQISTRDKFSRAAEIVAISKLPENSACADCRAPNPRWASWMLANKPCCIFICMICSGNHRSLGVHISKVKSVDLDDWTEEQIQSARSWGNVKANEVWEERKPDLSALDDRAAFCRAKYSEGRWKGSKEAEISAGGAQMPSSADDSVNVSSTPFIGTSEEEALSCPRPTGPRPWLSHYPGSQATKSRSTSQRGTVSEA